MAASLRRTALRFSRRIATIGTRWFTEPFDRQIRLIAARPQPLVGLFAGALLLGTVVVGAHGPRDVDRAPLLAADLTRLASAPAGQPIAAPTDRSPSATEYTNGIPFITSLTAPPEPPVAAPVPVADERPPATPQLAAAPAAPVAKPDPIRVAEKAVPVVAVPEDRALIAANRLELEPEHCQAGPDDRFGTLVHWSRNLDAAARQARADKKLVFAIQVSGNFANEEFT